MIFSDLWFLAFLLLSVPSVWITPKRFRRIALLLACVVFHAHYAGQAGMLPIILLAALVYSTLVARVDRASTRVFAAIVCVIALLYYKYAGFINELTGADIAVSAAPLAISFFVFEFVHLLVDRYQKKVRGRIHPLDFSIFAIFFPALASGPIKRYQQFVPELERLGLPPWPILSQSLFRILFGFFKKLCIADAIAAELPGTHNPDTWQGSVLTLAIVLGVRIYMDFSGYSDIAIGLAGLLNIRLPENFSFPYLATNISEFWRRWHISLSTWIRDYVYILLGGSRVSEARRFLNLVVAMGLCGLWHGAAVHFGIWGLLQGVALIAAHFWRIHAPVRMPRLVAWALTFVFVQASWLLFFYDGSTVLRLLKERPWI